jgi:hypothetical protein
MPPAGIPIERTVWVQQSLDRAREAVQLATREVHGARGEPARLRWAALGLVVALQNALVAALSGYETAELEAVVNPAEADRIAPLALLMRRARSEDYLLPPERVDLTGSGQRAIERVIAVRNAAVHALSVEIPETLRADLGVAARLIAHLVLDAPAFDPAPLRVVTALIRDDLKALVAALENPLRD